MSKQRPTISGIDKRGESVSILGFGVSLLGALTLAWLAIWGHSSSPAVWGVALQMFGAAGIWVLCWLNQHQRRLIAEERLELDELERQRRDKLGGVQTIFEDDELEQMDALASGRRLRSIERIITPVGALLIAAYHVWAGIALMPFLWSFPPLAASPGLPEFLQDANNQDFLKFVLFFAGGISFATFMMARYALGLRRVAGFGGLRAGGSYLFGSSLLSFGLAISMIFVIVGFMVFQARFAARHWRRVIAEGDQSALDQLLDDTFEAWRRERPRKGTPPADWRALHTAALVAADHQRIRVSLLAEPDVQVVQGRREEVSSAAEVAERAAVRMVERLMYEVPYVSFQQAQVDVLAEFRQPDGAAETRCLLTTRVTREQAAYAGWEDETAEEILGEWDTRRAAGGDWADPDRDAIIQPGAPEAVRAAEDALRRTGREEDGDA